MNVFLSKVRWAVSYNDGEALMSESMYTYNTKTATFSVSSLNDAPDVKL